MKQYSPTTSARIVNGEGNHATQRWLPQDGKKGDATAMNQREMTVELEKGSQIASLSCHVLVDHPLRMEFFSETHLVQLTDSIKKQGLCHPMMVEPLPDGHYRIISGHYRIRALRRLRCKQVPCIIHAGGRISALAAFCTANLMDRQCNPIEEAYIILGLIEQEGLTMQEIGEMFSHHKSWVSRRLKMLTALEPDLQRQLAQGSLRPRLAQELVRLPRGNEQERVLAIIKASCMNKDQASDFIDWWISASEKQRKEVEDRENDEMRKPPIAPDTYAAGILQRCQRNIEELLAFVTAREDVLWPVGQLDYLLEVSKRLQLAMRRH